jgi:hypothetical protein
MLCGMGWSIRSSLRSALIAGAITAGALVSCAEPTQIVVTVFSDACEGPGRPRRLNATNIYVGTSADIDTRPPSAVREGCETSTGIGSLTVYPSGDKDEEVAIKVVSGIDAAPDRCPPPGHAGCIAQKRVMRFIPNTTQRMVVKLSLACLNRTCPAGSTCDDGVCKQEQDVLEDGGTRANAPIVEAGVTLDASMVDAAVDPCTGCKGACAAGVCKVDCSQVDCKTGAELCAPTLPCEIECSITGGCADARCTTTESCAFDCGDKKNSCTRLACRAGTCDVKCVGTESCRTNGGDITLEAKNKATLLCSGDDACDRASCNAPTCELTCSPLGGSKSACPPSQARPCTGGCASWNNPIEGR